MAPDVDFVYHDADQIQAEIAGSIKIDMLF